MKRNKTSLPQDSTYPFKGLNTLDPDNMADPHYSPNCLNVYSDKGIVVKRKGYGVLGSTSFADNVLALLDYEAESGVLSCLAVTTKHQYIYDSSSSTWDECFTKVLDACTTVSTWNAEEGVTIGLVGGSVNFTVDDDFTTGLLATTDLFNPELDLTKGNGLKVSITPNYTTELGDLSLKFYTADTNLEVDLPVMTKSIENILYLKPDFSDMTAVTKVELILNTAFPVTTDISDTNLSAYWKMDETTGTTVSDESSNNNDGTSANAITCDDGVTGTAISFNGTTDKITVANSASLNLGASSDFSFSADIKTAGSANHNYILQKGDTNCYIQLFVRQNDDATMPGRITFNIKATADALAKSIHSTTRVDNNAWHHICIMGDRDGNLTMYLDNVSSGTPVSLSTLGDMDNTLSFYLGCASGSSGFFPGLLDNIRMYKRLLTADERAFLSGNNPNPPINATLRELNTCCIWTETEGAWVDSVEGLDINGRYRFMTNNIDPVIYWDGSSMQIYTPASGLDDFEKCRAIEIYLGSLVLGNLTIDGVNYPSSVAYSSPGDFFDHSSTDSDIVLLDGVKGGVEKIKVLGSALAIYGMSSIGITRFVEGNTGYTYDQIVSGETRILGGRSIISLGSYHALTMQDNIYLFDGTKNLVPIANYIYRTFVGSLEVDSIDTALAFNDTFNKMAYFVIPITNSEGSPDTLIFALNYADFTISSQDWTIMEFSNSPSCFGFYSEDLSYVWNSDVVNVPWNTFMLTWNECKASPGFPFTAFGSGKQVFLLNKRTNLDYNVLATGFWESIDFTANPTQDPSSSTSRYIPIYLSENARWIELELEMYGQDATVYYSIDKGLNWIEIEELELSAVKKGYKLWLDVVSPQIRIKVESDTFFALYWIRLWVTGGGI